MKTSTTGLDTRIIEASTTILAELRELGNQEFANGLQRFGIDNEQSLGVKVPELRRIARRHKNDHDLALRLWQYPIHEMKTIAVFIADPRHLTIDQSHHWTSDLYSWDLCDHLCADLLYKTDIWEELIHTYIHDDREFVKRTAFVIIASMAIKDKTCANDSFLPYIDLITSHCDDPRNFVKKGAQWALKNIGKRNPELAERCMAVSHELMSSKSATKRWIGRKTINDLRKHYKG